MSQCAVPPTLLPQITPCNALGISQVPSAIPHTSIFSGRRGGWALGAGELSRRSYGGPDPNANGGYFKMSSLHRGRELCQACFLH